MIEMRYMRERNITRNWEFFNRRFDRLVVDLIKVNDHAAFEIRHLPKRHVHKTEDAVVHGFDTVIELVPSMPPSYQSPPCKRFGHRFALQVKTISPRSVRL